MTAIAIAVAVSPMAVPDETNKDEDVLIMDRRQEIFDNKIRLWVGDSIKIFTQITSRKQQC